jgi:hypothetical protein
MTVYSNSLHRTLHAILAERLLFNIRGADSRVGSTSLPWLTTVPRSHMEFAVGAQRTVDVESIPMTEVIASVASAGDRVNSGDDTMSRS